MRKESNSADDFSYEIENDGVTITGYKGKRINVVIPNEIDGLPVVAIGDYAFYENELTNVVIPDSVETIGYAAFADNQLTNVVIPDSVKTIENSAFRDNELTDVVIPDSVKTIGEFAFAFNQLTNVVIPNSVETIAKLAFDDDVEIIRKDNLN